MMDNGKNNKKKLSIEDKLYLNNFKVYKEPHIRLKNKKMCRKCEKKPCISVCPVQNYREVNGEIEFSWEGCLECGSCRVVCKYGVIEWKYPQGGFGIKYKYG